MCYIAREGREIQSAVFTAQLLRLAEHIVQEAEDRFIFPQRQELLYKM